MKGSKKGWIKLHRAIQDNNLWNDKPYAKGQAWIDLLLLADHKDKTAIINGKKIDCKRGCIYKPITELSDRWGWERRKTDRFLKHLVKEGMITITSTRRKGSVIRISNYDTYQDGINNGTNNGTNENIYHGTNENIYHGTNETIENTGFVGCHGTNENIYHGTNETGVNGTNNSTNDGAYTRSKEYKEYSNHIYIHNACAREDLQKIVQAEGVAETLESTLTNCGRFHDGVGVVAYRPAPKETNANDDIGALDNLLKNAERS